MKDKLINKQRDRRRTKQDYRKKDNRKLLGNWGEQTAKEFLLSEGYILIAANWRNRSGEIDLIMQDSNVVVFIEVRTKESSSFGTGVESITAQKMIKIRETAASFLQYKSWWDKPIRFDLIAIDKNGLDYKITHLKNILE